MAEKCLQSDVSDKVTVKNCSNNNTTNPVEIRKRIKYKQNSDLSENTQNAVDNNKYTNTNDSDIIDGNSHSNSLFTNSNDLIRERNELVAISPIDKTATATAVIKNHYKYSKLDNNSTTNENEITNVSKQIQRCENQKENDSIGIYMETPVLDDNNVSLPPSTYEKNTVKPKRLSDDFFSSDDGDDEKLIIETTNINGIDKNGGSPSASSSRNNIVNTQCEKLSDVIESLGNTTTSNSKNENSNNLNGSHIDMEHFISGSASEFIEDDTNSSCSNIINLGNGECHSLKEDTAMVIMEPTSVSDDVNVVLGREYTEENNEGDDDDNDEDDDDDEDEDEQRVSSTLFENDVQSMDAIERRDFEQEQNLTGGEIIKTSALVSRENKLNLELLNKYKQKTKSKALSDNKCSNNENEQPSTPTTSRCCTIRLTKSNAKQNLSAALDRHLLKQQTLKQRAVQQQQEKQERINKEGTSDLQKPFKAVLPCSSSSRVVDATSSATTSSHCNRADKQYEMYLSSNSNDSLSSDKSYNTSSNHSLHNFFNKSSNSELLYHRGEVATTSTSKVCSVSSSSLNNDSVILSTTYTDSIASTSAHSSKCQYPHFCCEGSARAAQREIANCSSVSNESNTIAIIPPIIEKKKIIATSTASSSTSTSSSKEFCNFELSEQLATKSTSSRLSRTIDSRHFDEALIESSQISLPNEQTENDFDDETWGDCEDGSDEEVCTCYNYTECPGQFVEDELPSRDVDLSSYNQIVTINDDVFLQENPTNDIKIIQRKRKLNDSRSVESDCLYGDVTPGGRKRIALDCVSTPRNSLAPTSQLLALTSPTTGFERRTQRSLIPTKDNPPPELCDWLLQFQRWSHAERLLAVDRLIEHCEPTQVRHMMKVIEPQFQRDFISLLPKELALQVLSYLEPKDLLRAAQTCRSWRFLCDDNLLWKEKCKQAQIVIEPNTDRPKRGRAGNMPPISSPWKAAYMRQHIIEMNWRSRPIRQPKVLKGHDDHVITCLQFCGNRIVSGSDDNTLKVWSAITGKCLRTLVGHTGGVWSSQMSGNIIISGSTDRTLKVWNVETGQCIHTLLGHTSTVRCMHLHGNRVVSGSRDATLRVWDIELGICLYVLVGHLAAVRCVQYDGKLIVSGAYDYMVKVWSPERQECLHTLQGHTNRVYSLQFDGIHVVSGSLDTSIRVWDAETGSCKHTLMGHQSLTSGMELRQNILVSGNADSTVKVWDITTGQCLQTLSGPNKHQSAVTCLQFNSRFVITSSDDGTVKLWDVKTGEFIRNLVALDSGGSGGVVWRIRANDTKLICAVGSRNGTEETKLMVLDFDVEGACLKCS